MSQSKQNNSQPGESPRKARRAALRVLYGIDVADLPLEKTLEDTRDTLREEHDDADAYWEDVATRVRGVIDNLEKIDKEIKILSPTWRIERMAAVDRNLLRLGIFEILEGVTEPLIVINACVELAKEFGAASTPGFINGLLDQLCQNHKISLTD
jgi:N utilization substance protein B